MNDEQAEIFYRTAYEHGTEAFARGERLDQCGEHYNPGDPLVNPLAPLGVEGWRNGWRDAFCAAQDVPWWDDASYAAYQARD